MSLAEFHNAIKDRFEADQSAGSFYTAVGGRIRQARADDNQATFPYAVWEITNNPVVRYFEAADDFDAVVEVRIHAERDGGIDALDDVFDKLFTDLDGKSLSPTGYANGGIQCIEMGTTSIDDDAVANRSTWRMYASK